MIIPTSTIKVAIDCIGRERIDDFNDGVRSEEREIIRQLYDKFLMSLICRIWRLV